MNKRSFLFLIGLFLIVNLSFSQTYFGGKFSVINESQSGYTFTLYCFSRDGGTMKAKYFATNAYSQYENWKSGKNIMLVAPGAFSDGWSTGAKPVGLCVDNGTIVNREPNSSMDGMVIVYNGSSQAGGIAIVDLDVNSVKCETTYGSGKYEYYKPRENYTDRTNFLNWGSREGLTLFQTQLLYSKDQNKYLNSPSKAQERRFLAICYKNSVVHHVVVDAPNPLKLDVSAQYAKQVLERNGFNVWYMLNLDTGDKNLLYVYNGSYLRNLLPSSNERAKIENATNLLIYYKD